MKKLRKILVPTAIAATLLAGAAPTATAAVASTTFLVSANVLSFCAVTALPLAFGNYTGTQLDGSTTVAVTCTAGTTYSVGLSAGTSAGNTITARRMVRATGTELLNYGLFTDTGRATNWGDTPATNAIAGTGSGLPQTLTVYGRIPASQTLVIGAFSDLITVNVTY